MYQHSVTADALTDALVLMAIAMLLGRTGTLALRKTAAGQAGRSSQSGQSGQAGQAGTESLQSTEAPPKHPALAR